MPTRSDWITFEGRAATRRGANMVIEARKLFTKRTGKPGPGISQGGKAFASASGNTHAREAFDFRTASYTPALCVIWEECLWQVGFAAWWRRYVFNLWPQHHHAIPKGGDLSSAAANQEKAFENRRDGLAANGPYPRIGNYAYRTWEQYLRSRPKPPATITISGKTYTDIPYVSLAWLKEARKSGNVAKNVYWIQTWLTRTGHYNARLDGIWGGVTQAAWNSFCRSQGLGGDVPSMVALRALGRVAETRKPIREGK